MKVALIEPVGGHGGMNYYDMSLARGLAKSSVDVFWYTCDKTLEVSEEGVQVIKCFKGVYGPAAKWLRLWQFTAGLLVALWDARANGCKIIHYHFFGLGALECLMCIFAKFFGKIVCVTVHDVESFSSSKRSVFAKLICRLVDRFIVHNRSSLAELLNALPALGNNVEPPAVIPHGNYCEYVRRLDREFALEKLGLSRDDVIILFFGQVKEVKGLDILIAALPDVIGKKPNVKILIAGKVWKDDFSRYQKQINQLSLGKNIEAHIKYIPDGDVNLYYSAAEVVVLPYKKIYQSGVLLMAMSYGLPVIASDLAGMREVVSDGVNGYLFRAGDPSALSKAINRALTNDNESLGRKALHLMENEYSWSRVAEKTKTVYERLI
jgi:D-inositol-3-phosphate glycosyltransferase